MASSIHSQAAAGQSRERFGLIILGNSGAGKSFIANLFLQREKFASKPSATAVTTNTEFEEYTADGVSYVIFNIPGLIESNQEKIDKNKEEIDKAFLECPNSVVFYVFGNQMGRIRQEDVIAFNALHEAYPFKDESLVIVVNAIPSERERTYKGQTITLLREYLHMKTCEYYCFLDTIDRTNETAKGELRQELISAMDKTLPKVHEKVKNIHLQHDEIERLKMELQKIVTAFAYEKEVLEARSRAAQEQYEKEMKDIQERLTAQDKEKNDLQKQVTAKKWFEGLVGPVTQAVIPMALGQGWAGTAASFAMNSLRQTAPTRMPGGSSLFFSGVSGRGGRGGMRPSF
ncbi:unnamed protein product [Didymodactylos carnosus]|uniref:AIG1-type G domain-containing protein n=1 Tax=Didymodactylos carnosus TaxID=1234261 RepID=A0A815I863_9BILA|nr:unnamed protein product [Didymodactylos carnosus]CAF1417197.1 unnamed protein product [Didymodactylos carnosus]CAF4219064.1 unnamed protein product [Didymodactylos carnosus]CAF4237790.1 unnamed protein product [Didymodactylos carnosus]